MKSARYPGLVAAAVGLVVVAVVGLWSLDRVTDVPGVPGEAAPASGAGPESRGEAPFSGTAPAPESGEETSASRTAPYEVPVLLVPGWLDTARDLAALRIRLLGAGWSGEHVETITFDDPTGSNRDHADELAEAVDSILAWTGAGAVDIVAHSMGGLATRWYLETYSDTPVRKVVFIGTPHRGTLAAHLAWGEGRDEMMPESPFLDSLNARAPVPEGVEAITIRTLVDTHIVPGESATLPGVPDYELCCPTHAGLLRDDEVFRIVLDFLEGS